MKTLQGAVCAGCRARRTSSRDGAAARQLLRLGGQDVAKVSAKSALADPFRYTIKRREALTQSVTDGRLEPDNNIAENAMRGVALGHKNYLFAGSDTGSVRAAAMYTIIQTENSTT